ncbi:MAG: hypothetical protein ACI9EK_002270 [Psychroserpens sp.]|jgi:hypothetical protein
MKFLNLDTMNVEIVDSKLELARQLGKANHGKAIIYFNSGKARCCHYVDSINEKGALCHYEWNPFVLDFITQPFSILYSFNGRFRKYTPDLLVEYKNGDIKFVEIKEWQGVDKADFVEKFPTLQKVFNDVIGFPLELFNKTIEMPGKTSANIDVLLRYKAIPMDEKLNQQIKQSMSYSENTMRDLLSASQAHRQSAQYAMSMLYHREFTFDLSKIINHTTLLQAA